MLSIANTLDSSRAETWGYLALVLMQKPEPKVNAAYQTMNEGFKLGMSDLMLINEISYQMLSKR